MKKEKEKMLSFLENSLQMSLKLFTDDLIEFEDCKSNMESDFFCFVSKLKEKLDSDDIMLHHFIDIYNNGYEMKKRMYHNLLRSFNSKILK